MASVKKAYIYIILIACGILLLAGGGVLVWEKKQGVTQPQPGTQTIEQPANTDEMESAKDLIDGEYTFTPIDTSDWQTYRNEELGFEVKVPKDWLVRDHGVTGVALNSKENEELLKEVERGEMYGEGYGNDIEITYNKSVSEIPENTLNKLGAKTLDEFVERNNIITKIQKIQFAGETAWVVVLGGFGASLAILVEHNGHVYQVAFGYKESLSKLSAVDFGILGSFSFVK